MKSLQLPSCDAQVTQLFNALKGLRADHLRLSTTPSIDIVVQDGWYKISIAENIYVAVYVDKSDPVYNYIITIINIADVISICNSITIEKRYKSGVPAPDNVIPQSTIDKAVASFPAATIACGTGLWDGCTFSIPNKYIITAGALAAGLYYIALKDKV